jgi:uncharacterized protein (DUF433 family)
MSAPATVEIGTLITRTPGIKRGTPHIAGTGVTVRTIARWYKLGLSPEEIAAEISHLTLAQVYAALAYYHANLEDMEAHMAAEEAESERIEQEHLRPGNTATLLRGRADASSPPPDQQADGRGDAQSH